MVYVSMIALMLHRLEPEPVPHAFQYRKTG
jgi:hypothetical protein